MTKEKLKKVEAINADIEAYNDLLRCREIKTAYFIIAVRDSFEELITDEIAIRVNVWDKMLDVLEQERDRLIKEFEKL